jgi:uncharacterized damage-inducible protein DinB
MLRAVTAEARAFDSWSDYQEALTRAVAPLSDEQLRRRPIPGRRSPGEIAEHIVFGRALHLQGVLGDEASELADLLRWDDPDEPPHTATEIVEGLERTWRVIGDRLMRGSPADALRAEEATVLQTIWGLLDHDLPHAGQLSLLLAAAGLPGVEI